MKKARQLTHKPFPSFTQWHGKAVSSPLDNFRVRGFQRVGEVGCTKGPPGEDWVTRYSAKGGRSVSVVLDSEPADVEVSAVVGAWLSVVTAGAELTGVAEDIPAGAGAAVLVEEVLFLLIAAGMSAVVFTVVFVISVVVNLW